MIKFFRKIRQQLLAKNKFSRYLIYALGEIALVVIGILIALQINNWNEAQQSNLQQRKYLSLIKTEMANNLDALEVEKQRLNEVLEGLRGMISLTDQSSSEISEKDFAFPWGKAFSKTIRLKYENGALTELISSGVLKEISNDTIRNTLASWESKIQKLVSQENETNAYLQKGNDYLEKHGDVRTIIDVNNGNAWWGIGKSPSPGNNIDLLKSTEFGNIVVFSIGTGGTLNRVYLCQT